MLPTGSDSGLRLASAAALENDRRFMNNYLKDITLTLKVL